jgi:hypothetical protein
MVRVITNDGDEDDMGDGEEQRRRVREKKRKKNQLFLLRQDGKEQQECKRRSRKRVHSLTKLALASFHLSTRLPSSTALLLLHGYAYAFLHLIQWAQQKKVINLHT